jgi:SAM domain (Sterile alpha motif)
LRYGVTGHLAENQPVRSRCRWMNRPTASRAAGPRLLLWTARAGDLRERPLDPQGPALGSPFWSVSRQAIYRVKSLIQRVHKAEFSRAWAAMQEIADWLTRLGLPEYAGAFAENGIDVSVLERGDSRGIGAIRPRNSHASEGHRAHRAWSCSRGRRSAERPTGAGRSRMIFCTVASGLTAL